jgi:hypothetical protein
MAENNWQKKSDGELLMDVHVLVDALNGPNGPQYGISNTTKTGLVGSRTAFSTSVDTFHVKKSEALAATQDKKAKRTAMTEQLVNIANAIYNNPTITDALIADAGLAVRDKVRTPVTPKIPQDLVATPFANGTVKLTWKRSGNPKNAMFFVESRGETGDWTLVGQTMRSKLELEGFTPGVFARFRVKAVTSTAWSLHSNIAVIYSDEQEGGLEVAA